MSENLRNQLKRAEKTLELIMAIDEIRDKPQDPTMMLGSIVNLVADEFKADVCLLVLIDRDMGELELKAINDRGRSFGRLNVDSIKGLAKQALKEDSIDVWDGSGVAAAFGMDKTDGQMQLAVMPVIMGARVRLGAMFILRSDRLFSDDDLALLNAIESQLDSAVIQGYDYFEMKLRNAELETIYRVDRIRDQNLPFDEMLSSVLDELRGVIQAEMGFIMLYDHHQDELELRAYSHDDLFLISDTYEVIASVANEAMDGAKLIFHNELPGSLRAVMAIPLILRDEILGVFGVANSTGRNFDERERRLLTAIASQMDTAIFESLEQRRLRRVLGRSVDPRVMERLLTNPDVDFLKGERQMISVLYADLRGSTALAERTEPEVLVGFINEYLGAMADVIFEHEGTLDKFVGDEVMALFGAPFPQEDHALRAVQVGLAMQEAHQTVMEKWAKKGVDTAPVGVGIATGELIVGEMGSSQRTDYTVIGRAANLGARICSAAGQGQVLISEATYEAVKDEIEAEAVTGLQMKGLAGDIVVYRVKT